ncbi:MAG: hypothetical protein ACRC0L_12190, partial [Angustibacter sp.]
MRTTTGHCILSGWGPRRETPQQIAVRVTTMIEGWSHLPGSFKGEWEFDSGAQTISTSKPGPFIASIADTVNEGSLERHRREVEGWSQVIFSPVGDGGSAYAEYATVNFVAGATESLFRRETNSLKVDFEGDVTSAATDAGMLALARMLVTTWEPDWLSYTSIGLVRQKIAIWGRDALTPRPGYVTWLSPAVVDHLPQDLPARVTPFAGGWLLDVLPMDDADQRAL